MISFLASCLVRVFLKNKIIERVDSEVYQYGFEILISSIITLSIAVITGFILHCIPAALLYFVIFAGLRQICGGYHAHQYWSCNLLFAIVTISVLLIFKYLSMEEFVVAHYIFLALSILIIFIYAPVENENKPLSKHQKRLFRIVSRVVIVIMAAISCLIYILQIPYTKLIDCTLLVVALSILVVGIAERSELYEKGNEE